jgi:MurNAc alpha-1-phosphate uridylyltransferase
VTEDLPSLSGAHRRGANRSDVISTGRVQAVVLAGGLATRMHPRTLTVPKSLLEVAGRPFVDWQLERLVATGLRDVVMCVGYLGEQIRAHVGDGSRCGARVLWSEEGATLLGTGGALRRALPLLAPSFVVTYGDSYLPFDYAEPLRVLETSGDCDGAMAIYKNEGRWDTSNVFSDGSWVLRYAKNSLDDRFDYIDYGAIAFRRDVIAALPLGHVSGLDGVQSDLASRNRLRAVVARERFYEIGSPEGLAELERYLRTGASS